MKCPHCAEELPWSTCPECGGEVPEGARFCMHCGTSMDENVEAVPSEGKDMDQEDAFDLEARILCPDGTCTGIIVNGKCTECGKTPEEAQKEDEAEPEEGGEAQPEKTVEQ